MMNWRQVLFLFVVLTVMISPHSAFAKKTKASKKRTVNSQTETSKKTTEEKKEEETDSQPESTTASTDEGVKPAVPVTQDTGSGRYHMLNLGAAVPTKDFVLDTSFAVGYDFFYSVPNSDFNYRFGLWGLTKNLTEGDYKYTYTLMNIDVGVDYFILNGNFKLGVGGRLGVSVPFVTIHHFGLEEPFSGKTTVLPSLSISSYYRSYGYIFGFEARAAFYSESRIGVPTHVFLLAAFGKEI